MTGPRLALPPRRPSDTFAFMFGPHKFYCTFSRYDDGRVAEIFLQGGKSGTEIEAQARDQAILASHLLQRGAALAEIQASLTRTDGGRAATPVCAAVDEVVRRCRT